MRLVYQLKLTSGKNDALAVLYVDVPQRTFDDRAGLATLSGRILRLTGPASGMIKNLTQLELGSRSVQIFSQAGDFILKEQGKHADVEVEADISPDWKTIFNIVVKAKVTDPVVRVFIKSARFTGSAKLYKIESDPIIVPPIHPPAPKPVTHQVLILGLTRQWRDLTARDHATLVFDYGQADWMGIELHGLEPESIKTPAQMEAYYRECVDDAAAHILEAKHRGKPVAMYWVNSHLDQTDEMDVAGHKRCLAYAEKVWGGWEGIYVMPYNERDAMKPGVADFLDRYFFDKLDTKATILYQRTHPEALWNEWHPFGTAKYGPIPGSYRNIIATDNDASISEMSDGGGFMRGRPNVGKASTVVATIAKKGCSAHLYNNYEGTSVAALASWFSAVGAAWHKAVGLEPVPPSDVVVGLDVLDLSKVTIIGKHALTGLKSARITKTLQSAKITGMLWYEYTPRPTGWDTDSPIGGDIDQRLIFIFEADGKTYAAHFDWNRPGRRDKELKNLRNGYIGRAIPAGARCALLIANDWSGRGFERSNVVWAGNWLG